MAFQALLYYFFTPIEDPIRFAADHRRLCESLELRGRILIAEEGINGTVSGSVEACTAYQQAMQADPMFAGIEFKVDDVDGHVFKALYIRVRPEIITLGEPLSHRVEQLTGKHLSPPEWREMMEQDDVVILDGRNHYESLMGHFEGAITPEVGSFRELPEWLNSHRDLFEGKKVLTYCTGGIRCEKLTTYMLEAGFGDVYQLHGGVVQYGKHPETQGEGWLGVNVVFDDRISTPVGTKSKPLTQCESCGTLAENLVNCANVMCNKRMILCAECEATLARCCSDVCREAPKKRQRNKKLHESLTSVQA